MAEETAAPAPAMGRITAPLLWVYGTSLLGLVLQISGTAVLARLLAPQAFGEIAMAAAIMRIVQHVAHLGLASTLTRESHRITSAARALVMVPVISSLGFAGLVWFCAPLLLWLQPEAQNGVSILRTLAFGPAFAACGLAAAALLQSRLDFRRLGLAQVAGQALGQFGVAIPLALAGAGVWSLVCGSLAQAILLAGFLRLLARPGWQGPLAAPPDLLRLGRRFMLLRLLDVAGHTIPPLAVVTLLGLTAAGSYDRAFVLTVLPLDMLATGLAAVLFPIYARQASQQEAARLLQTSIALGGGILLAVATGLVLARDYLVLAVLGPQWQDAIPLLGWLAILGFLRGLQILNGSLVEARSNLKFRSLQQVCYLLALTGLLALRQPDTMADLLESLLVVETLNLIPLVWLSARLTRITLGAMLASLGAALYPGLAVAAALAVLVPALADWPPVMALCLCVAVAAAALVAVLYWHPAAALRIQVRQLLQNCRPAVQRPGDGSADRSQTG